MGLMNSSIKDFSAMRIKVKSMWENKIVDVTCLIPVHVKGKIEVVTSSGLHVKTKEGMLYISMSTIKGIEEV